MQRRAVRIAVLTALVALLVTSAATARTKDDDARHLALLTVQKNLTAAREAEKLAYFNFKSGNDARARSELK